MCCVCSSWRRQKTTNVLGIGGGHAGRTRQKKALGGVRAQAARAGERVHADGGQSGGLSGARASWYASVGAGMLQRAAPGGSGGEAMQRGVRGNDCSGGTEVDASGLLPLASVAPVAIEQAPGAATRATAAPQTWSSDTSHEAEGEVGECGDGVEVGGGDGVKVGGGGDSGDGTSTHGATGVPLQTAPPAAGPPPSCKGTCLPAEFARTLALSSWICQCK